MSENELLREWTATGEKQYLNKLLERLYVLGERKLSDKVSKDVLHNSILKIHARLEKGGEIREIRSFFLKTLYNGVMDFYKKDNGEVELCDDHCEAEEFQYPTLNFDLDKLCKLEQLLRSRRLGRSRLKYLHAILIERSSDTFSRQSRFFHRTELHKEVSLESLYGNNGTSAAADWMTKGLLDLQEIGRYFPYELRRLHESEDDEQDPAVQQLFKRGVEYKRRALEITDHGYPYEDSEQSLLVLLNMTIALHLFRQATELNPMFFKSRFSIGFCSYKLNRFDDAVKEFHAALFYLERRRGQSNFAVKMGSTLRNLGIIYLIHLKQFHHALSSFERALAHTPDDDQVRLGLIFSACKLNDMEIALEHIRALDRSVLCKSIEDWTTNNSAAKIIALDIYKENEAIREYIPIEKII